MQGLNLTYIYQLSEKFDSLRLLKADTLLKDVWLDLYFAQSNIQEIYNQAIFSHALRTSRTTASNLYEKIDEFLKRQQEDETATLSAYDVSDVVNSLEQLETVLKAELTAADVYLVTPIGAYDTKALLHQPQLIWPEDLLVKLPSTKVDVQELSKCIAFELPTAAGFHAVRIVESVLRAYWDVVTKGEKHPKNKTLGAYISALENKVDSDKKVLAALKQLKDLHRNPLMHPEVHLSVEDAVIFLGIAFSVVAPMLKVVSFPKNTKPTDNET